jgi:hypothetical protein
MNIRNEEIDKLIVEIPEGHMHLRTTFILKDGTEITFQEATIANLVRAFITVKTHPNLTRVKLENKQLQNRKKGFDEWQLI